MNIQIVSDLHLEGGASPPTLAPGADMLICAGDLGQARYPWLLAKAAKAWRRARHILYVPGNHEYYGGLDLEESRQLLAWQCATNDVTLLDPGAVTIAGIRFIGATLWTDFRVDGIARESAAHAKAAQHMEDFKGQIRSHGGTRDFTTHESARRHSDERVHRARARKREGGGDNHRRRHPPRADAPIGPATVCGRPLQRRLRERPRARHRAVPAAALDPRAHARRRRHDARRHPRALQPRRLRRGESRTPRFRPAALRRHRRRTDMSANRREPPHSARQRKAQPGS